MKLDLELSKPSVWGTALPREKEVAPIDTLDVFSRPYIDPIKFLNALSLHVAQEYSADKGLSLAFCSEFTPATRFLGQQISCSLVLEAFRNLPDENNGAIKELISRLQRGYSFATGYGTKVYVYDFEICPPTPSYYFGFRGSQFY